jgi:hypothetical protein
MRFEKKLMSIMVYQLFMFLFIVEPMNWAVWVLTDLGMLEIGVKMFKTNILNKKFN